MLQEQKDQIERISKDFVKGLGIEIKGSTFLAVDPLAGYLDFIGYPNAINQIPETADRPLILIIEFQDGTQFVPAGSDIPVEGSKDWLWIDPK